MAQSGRHYDDGPEHYFFASEEVWIVGVFWDFSNKIFVWRIIPCGYPIIEIDFDLF